MEIKPIKSLRTQMIEGALQRKGSQKKLALAQTCMHKAIENNMAPALVKRALSIYSELIDEHPGMPQPYLAIAYLSWKMDEDLIAERFLQSLLDIHPCSVQAQTLLSEIQNSRQESHRKQP